jgi:CheY-like chemotaxis protein
VLIAEDVDAVRTVTRQLLQRHGYTVLDAPNGAMALQTCVEYAGPIHLLLTDVVMPDGSGSELAQRVTKRKPDTKILFMSGYTDDAVVRHGILQAGIAYLQKPFSREALLRKVREVLDS